MRRNDGSAPKWKVSRPCATTSSASIGSSGAISPPSTPGTSGEASTTSAATPMTAKRAIATVTTSRVFALPCATKRAREEVMPRSSAITTTTLMPMTTA